jgi:hypothetical protein
MAFRDINRGPELKIAYDNLRQYEQKSREEKVAAYKAATKNTNKAKHARMPIYILPFDAKVGQFLETRGLSATQDGLGGTTAVMVRTLVVDQFKTALAATEASLKVPKYKFARLIATERTATATTDSPSRFTKNPYKHHTTVSASCPFGASAATQNYSEAVNLITAKTAFENFEKTPGNSLSFDPQG